MAEAEGLQRSISAEDRVHIHPSKLTLRNNIDAMIRRLRPLTRQAGTSALRRAVGEKLIRRQAAALSSPRERELQGARRAMVRTCRR